MLSKSNALQSSKANKEYVESPAYEDAGFPKYWEKHLSRYRKQTLE